MFNNAKKDLFLTEAKTLFKETSNKFITSSLSESSSKNIYCKSSSAENNPLDVTTNNTYYYIETNSTGNITKFVVWNDSNYLVKQTGDDIKITSLDSVSVEESLKDIKCSDTNILEKLGFSSESVKPVFNKNDFTVDVSTSSGNIFTIKLSTNSTNNDFKKVKYEVTKNSGKVTVCSDNVNIGSSYECIDKDSSGGTSYTINIYTEYGDLIATKYETNSYCFVAGTKVKTENGFKNIEDIKVGEKVYSYNLDNNSLELKTVLNTIISESIDTYTIKVGTEEIEMTPRHELYIIDKGWVRAYDVKVGDKLYSSDGELLEIEKIT